MFEIETGEFYEYEALEKARVKKLEAQEQLEQVQQKIEELETSGASSSSLLQPQPIPEESVTESTSFSSEAPPPPPPPTTSAPLVPVDTSSDTTTSAGEPLECWSAPFEVKFVMGTLDTALFGKTRFQKLFHLAYLANTSVHHIGADLNSLLVDSASVVVETPKFSETLVRSLALSYS